MLDRVSPNDIVYDIGANRGYITLGLLSNIPSTRILAFEPNPELLPKLRANLLLNQIEDHVEIIDYAIGDQNGAANFYISVEDSASSLNAMHSKIRGGGIHSVVKVQLKTLDALVQKGQIPAPKHIKIDTEGFEMPILLGAQETIQEYLPFVYAEIHSTDGQRDNEPGIRATLTPYGYTIKKEGRQLLCTPGTKPIRAG
jgi:FkbM family methyltransferase